MCPVTFVRDVVGYIGWLSMKGRYDSDAAMFEAAVSDAFARSTSLDEPGGTAATNVSHGPYSRL